MHTKSENRAKHLNVFLGMAGLVCILLACACLVLLLSLQVDDLWYWYRNVQEKLTQLEAYIRSLRPYYFFIPAVLLTYTARGFVPIFSISAICLMVGVALPAYLALPLNLIGVAIIMTIKYYKGKRSGGGTALRFFVKNVPVRKLLERDGAANPWLLFAFRLIPSFPEGSISRIYGAMDFGYKRYILISLAGFAPKLFSYTFIGQNVFDPLSAKFLTPIIVILLISGFSLLFINAIWSFVDKNVQLTLQERIAMRTKRKKRLKEWKEKIL